MIQIIKDLQNLIANTRLSTTADVKKERAGESFVKATLETLMLYAVHVRNGRCC